MQVLTLPYTTDTSKLFARLRHLSWAQYLDSCHPQTKQGRYDIITALPYVTLTTCAELTTITSDRGEEHSHRDPFTLIDHYLQPYQHDNDTTLPFSGGALGYFSYDLARRFERLPAHSINDITMPDMAVGIYDWAIVTDHHEQQTLLVQQNHHPKTAEQVKEILALLEQPEPAVRSWQLTQPLKPTITPTDYAHAFNQLQTYIHNGDCYEVNYTQRFQAKYQGDPWYLYQHLRVKNPVPFGAYLQFPFAHILSCSPERFLHVHNRCVSTQPMKGTQPRSTDPKQDQHYANTLLASEKDRAENLMIVDLMRNDLSKVCEVGSVRVPQLFKLESFPAVHHLVSTVAGTLCADKTNLDLLRACFPGGSITGAPKIRVMEIIAELEPYQRGIYCGSIGYIGLNGNMDTSIAIRTLTCCDQQLIVNAGGAIVADSTCDAEYAECETKLEKIKTVLAQCAT